MNPSVLCFRKVPVAKSFWIREGGVSSFSVEIFSSHIAENFVSETFSVSLVPGTGKVWIREGGVSIKFFRRKFFVSQCRNFS